MEPTREEILKEADRKRALIITNEHLQKKSLTVNVTIRKIYSYEVVFTKEGDLWDNGTILTSP